MPESIGSDQDATRFLLQPAPESDPSEIDSEQASGDVKNTTPLTDEDVAEMRKEKIRSVQAAIAAGKYDDQAILEEAMRRMIQQVDFGSETE